MRNSDAAAKAARSAAKICEKPAAKPIAGGDFRAWDKYDVEKGLDDADSDEDVDAETEAHRAMQLQEHLGNAEKDKGNAQFKQGKYAAAIACYSRGIEYDPFNVGRPAPALASQPPSSPHPPSARRGQAADGSPEADDQGRGLTDQRGGGL